MASIDSLSPPPTALFSLGWVAIWGGAVVQCLVQSSIQGSWVEVAEEGIQTESLPKESLIIEC